MLMSDPVPPAATELLALTKEATGIVLGTTDVLGPREPAMLLLRYISIFTIFFLALARACAILHNIAQALKAR